MECLMRRGSGSVMPAATVRASASSLRHRSISRAASSGSFSISAKSSPKTPTPKPAQAFRFEKARDVGSELQVGFRSATGGGKMDGPVQKEEGAARRRLFLGLRTLERCGVERSEASRGMRYKLAAAGASPVSRRAATACLVLPGSHRACRGPVQRQRRLGPTPSSLNPLGGVGNYELRYCRFNSQS